jgi:hypothetical protein
MIFSVCRMAGGGWVWPLVCSGSTIGSAHGVLGLFFGVAAGWRMSVFKEIWV